MAKRKQHVHAKVKKVKRVKRAKKARKVKSKRVYKVKKLWKVKRLEDGKILCELTDLPTQNPPKSDSNESSKPTSAPEPGEVRPGKGYSEPGPTIIPLEESSNPLRSKILNAADVQTLPGGAHHDLYGDPLTNLEAIVALKNAFWSHAAIKYGPELHKPGTSFILPAGQFLMLSELTPFGHAIDGILSILGSIASAPSPESALAKKHYEHICELAAIAFEVGTKTVKLGAPDETK